ncbi:MAG: hypothetical protein GC150_07660 [Rhizobiales bacterium]|nr:hypothetical protein [Hyphomicrobiales bacterium]
MTNGNHDTRHSGFESDAGHFSRSTPLSYAYADIALALVWNIGLLFYAPSWLVFLPALVTGTAAVLVDYVWFYRSGRREVLRDGRPADGLFIAWWLVFWFEFLIAWNIGTFVGLALTAGLTTTVGLAWTLAFCAWFWVVTPGLSRALGDFGVGNELVLTTRRVGSRLSFARITWVAVLYTGLLATILDWDLAKAAELFAIGMLAAGAMEIPLYVLNIRPGPHAWKALVVNTLVEWNYAVPIFFVVFALIG